MGETFAGAARSAARFGPDFRLDLRLEPLQVVPQSNERPGVREEF
jgi:hypothetical protein